MKPDASLCRIIVDLRSEASPTGRQHGTGQSVRPKYADPNARHTAVLKQWYLSGENPQLEWKCKRAWKGIAVLDEQMRLEYGMPSE